MVGPGIYPRVNERANCVPTLLAYLTGGPQILDHLVR